MLNKNHGGPTEECRIRNGRTRKKQKNDDYGFFDPETFVHDLKALPKSWSVQTSTVKGAA